MKIYTKTGDRGETGLIGGRRVRKDDAQVAAYGDVDELNCWLGACAKGLPELGLIQKELFVIGSILAGQKAKAPKADHLERRIDAMETELPSLTKFILPGGGETGARLHVARAVCRRAERSVVGLPDAPADVVIYLNRLSDYLFVAARWVNHKAGEPETQWEGL